VAAARASRPGAAPAPPLPLRVSSPARPGLRAGRQPPAAARTPR